MCEGDLPAIDTADSWIHLTLLKADGPIGETTLAKEDRIAMFVQ